MVKTGEGLAGQGGAKIRSLPEQKGPQPTAARGGQRENCIRPKEHRDNAKGDPGASGGEEKKQ